MAASQIDSLKMIRAQIRHVTRDIVHFERRIGLNQRKIFQLQERIDRQASTPANRRRWELQIADLTRIVAGDQAELQELADRRNGLLEREQEQAARVDEREQNQYAIPASATDSVTVRMLSGDMLNVMVDSRQKVRDFPLEFARQFGYNPKVVSRFQFLIPNQDAEDGELVDILANDQDYELSWLDRFENADNFPLLNLLIQSSSDADSSDKISLIREIAEKQKLSCTMSDEDIMERYNSWYLTYQPPAKSNRYTTLTDFVKSNSDLFPPIPQEDLDALIQQQNALEQRFTELGRTISELNERRDNLVLVQRIRAYDVREHQLIERYTREEDDYQHQRAMAAISFAQQMQADPTAAFMNEPRTREHFIHCLTRFEMFEMGYTQILLGRCNCRTRDCRIENADKQAIWRLHTEHLAEFGENSNEIIFHQVQQFDAEIIPARRQERDEISIEYRVLNRKIYRMGLQQ